MRKFTIEMLHLFQDVKNDNTNSCISCFESAKHLISNNNAIPPFEHIQSINCGGKCKSWRLPSRLKIKSNKKTKLEFKKCFSLSFYEKKRKK